MGREVLISVGTLSRASVARLLLLRSGERSYYLSAGLWAVPGVGLWFLRQHSMAYFIGDMGRNNIFR